MERDCGRGCAVTGIVEFLTARLDEDQAAAEAWDEAERTWRPVGRRNLRYDNGSGEPVQSIDTGGGQGLLNEQIWVKHDYDGERTAHIARHDPTRVLREVAAKRRILALHEPQLDRVQWRRDETCYQCSRCTGGGREYDQVHGVMLTELSVWPCLTVMLLAAPYADHPDYKAKWRLT